MFSSIIQIIHDFITSNEQQEYLTSSSFCATVGSNCKKDIINK